MCRPVVVVCILGQTHCCSLVTIAEPDFRRMIEAPFPRHAWHERLGGRMKELPRRRNRLRYPGHDYSSPGAVFVTICVHHRQPLLGEVRQGEMHLSPVGEMVASSWERIPTKYPEIALDIFVVMPDHVHGILFSGVDPECERRPATVGDAVRWFKNVTLRCYRDGVLHQSWAPYEDHFWQDKFNDHIIRTAREMANIRSYIERNPERWWEPPTIWGLPSDGRDTDSSSEPSS